jgi:hypothetical protein
LPVRFHFFSSLYPRTYTYMRGVYTLISIEKKTPVRAVLTLMNYTDLITASTTRSAGLEQYIGQTCQVELRPVRYCFTNVYGQKIAGRRYVLVDIGPEQE